MIGLGFGNFQAVTQAPFSFGNALRFDGANDNVTFSTISLTEGTISFYVNPKQNNYLRVIGADGSANFSYINPQIGFSKVLFRVNSAANQVFFTDPIGMTQNNWYHIVCTFNSTTANCYVNGQACAENPFSLSATSQTVQFVNMGRLWNTTNYSQHITDELAIWNTVLSATDVANLYNSGNGDYATNYSPDNLQAYWRMNGSGTDTIAVDEQGNYDGTLNNFPASGMWVAH